MSTIERLNELAKGATPQDIDSAEWRDHDGSFRCPFCGGDGNVDGETFGNYDGVALGVQFFGIGDQMVKAEQYFRACNPAAIAQAHAEYAALERRNAELVEALQAIVDYAAEPYLSADTDKMLADARAALAHSAQEKSDG